MPAQSVEGLLRELAPEVLGVLLRRHGQFDACEDAEDLRRQLAQEPLDAFRRHGDVSPPSRRRP